MSLQSVLFQSSPFLCASTVPRKEESVTDSHLC